MGYTNADILTYTCMTTGIEHTWKGNSKDRHCSNIDTSHFLLLLLDHLRFFYFSLWDANLVSWKSSLSGQAEEIMCSFIKASAMCYVLKNGLCYVLCKTPWGAPITCIKIIDRNLTWLKCNHLHCDSPETCSWSTRNILVIHPKHDDARSESTRNITLLKSLDKWP